MSKLSNTIRKQVSKALNDYNMIADGDQIMVACSGGKDSSILLLALEEIRKKSPIKFTLHPVMLDQKQPGFDAVEFIHFMREHNLNITLLQEDTYSIVKEKTPEGKAFCGICSRLRRGILYTYAKKHQYNSIALGHHRDDMNQTLLMNLFFAGKIAGMPPKLKSDDGENIVIRPLAYCAESDLIALAKEYDFPVVPCNLCGTQSNLQRQEMKKMLQQMELNHPNIGAVMQNAQANVRPSQLADHNLWDFSTL
ncbi:tRNA 2-thiocytidine(32) synthetase TtcA [Lentisphaera profundi]|uniref:tRNA 2-thiocytidine(32) synthetase TtcA n=1 Tax=Lentisphaera profundi TaxID=1658616 RepID=A0ABY7VS32_9BACT|nr:tRNA 2-thiocytidine(32) synthetase TtcA [Lentisphaera profundi]WDE96038.1 tRNA 2-thiocytidine(32) synthetase TtcA [Lentisphaera profundi]